MLKTNENVTFQVPDKQTHFRHLEKQTFYIYQ